MNTQGKKVIGYQLLSGSILLLLLLGLLISIPELRSFSVLIRLLERKAYLLFALLGMVFLQASGSVDFSCITQMMMTSALLFFMTNDEIGIGMAVFFCILIGAGMGAMKGITIGHLGLTATAACICTMIVYYGIYMILGQDTVLEPVIMALQEMLNVRFAGISVIFLLAVLGLFFVDVFFNMTYWGKEILSAKLAPDVVKRAGINLSKIVILTSAACGALMSISAVTYVAEMGEIQAENGIEILAQTMVMTHMSGASMSPKWQGLSKLKTLRVLATLLLLVMMEECCALYNMTHGILYIIYGTVSGISIMSSKGAGHRRKNRSVYYRA